jgi:hypothetical protein
MPPTPVPMIVAVRCASGRSKARPESFTAARAATTAIAANRSRKASRRDGKWSSGLKSWTSAAIRVRNISCRPAWIGLIPLCPSTKADQKASMVLPTGETTPRPVTATRLKPHPSRRSADR